MRDIKFTVGTVSFFSTSNAANNIGGVIGNCIGTNMVDSSFSGSIGVIGQTQPPSITVGGETRLGGLIGYHQAPITESCFIDNCTARGDLTFQGNYYKYIGGVLGYSVTNGTVTITNSFFEEGVITVSGSLSSEVGGFGGLFASGGVRTINNCGTLGGTINTETKIVGANTDSMYVGGFTGNFTGTISNCFSHINISTYNEYNAYVGGFIGRLYDAGSSINACYATGTVSVVQNGDSSGNEGINSGGLVGYNQYGTVSNSYALGNVLANKQSGTGDLRVGGLAGMSNGNSSVISNSFSTGQVSARSASGTAYAGGLVGVMGSSTPKISNSAALGLSVTVQTAGTKAAGRIYGYNPILNMGTNNYALATMVIADDPSYATLNPATRSAVSGLTRPDGYSVAASTFLNKTTWEDPVNGLGFTTSDWNFARVGIDGYPRLKWE